MSRILITGGTGSLGHALVDYYLHQTDHRVVVYSRDELKQAQMRDLYPQDRLDFFLGDVRDLARLRLAFDADIDVVIHAAALKRIDSVCHDPDEVLKTNILGSRNVLHAACGVVPKTLLISSDKAVYPTNAYGVSKAMAEHLFTTYNIYSGPKDTYSAVIRYGNVLGSRGSVVHIWRQQIRQQLPLTLTDPRMSRFIITLPQAVAAIESSLSQMQGGEIFVPILKAAWLLDLANAVTPTGEVVYTGLRPGGEKLHETLISDEEAGRVALPVSEGLLTIIPHSMPWKGLGPMWVPREVPPEERSSDQARKLSKDELTKLLEDL